MTKIWLLKPFWEKEIMMRNICLKIFGSQFCRDSCTLHKSAVLLWGSPWHLQLPAQISWLKTAQMLASTSSISKPQLRCTQPTNECNLPQMVSSLSYGPIFHISLNEQGSERDAQAEMLRSLSSHGGLGRLETQISDSEPWSNSLYGNDPLEVHMSVLGS